MSTEDKKTSNIFSESEIVDAGACPNCWGRQQYDHHYIQFVDDQTKDNINHNPENQKAFIQQFVETYVTGIKLKNVDTFRQCPVCSKGY